MTELFFDVVNVMMSKGLFTCGDLFRFALSAKCVCQVIYSHPYFWKGIAKQMFGLKKQYSNYTIINKFSKKCRECGSNHPHKLLTSKFNSILVCASCQTYGYNKLYSLDELNSMGYSKYHVKKNNKFVIAKSRKGLYRKNFYWFLK